MIELDAFRIPLLIAGLATAGVGAWAIAANIPHGTRRVFGILLLIKGLNLVAAGLMSSGWPEAVGPLLVVQHYLLLAVVPLAIYFISIFPTRRGPLAFRGSGYLVVGAILILELLYFVDHGLVHTLAPGDGADGLQTAGPGWVYTGYGPLVILLALFLVAFPTIGLVFAKLATAATGKDRTVYAFFAIGLLVNGLFDGGLATAYLIHDPSINSLSGFGWILGVIRALALLPAGIALGILIGSELTKPKPDRWMLLVPAVLALAAWFSGPMPVILGAPDYGATWPTAVSLGLWRTVVAVMVGIGLWRLHASTASTAPVNVAMRPSPEEA